MTALPASGYLENSSRTTGEMKQGLEDVRDVIAELPGGQAQSELTISSGSVTPTAGIHSIDTEGDAASDNLDNIVTTNHPDGRLLLIRAEDSSRTVVVRHNQGGAGQIALVDNASFSLDDTEKWLMLKRTGTDWEEVMRGYRAATATEKGVVELATSAETITGTDTERAVTPAGIQAKVASSTAKGIVELATSAETVTGTDTGRAVTPAGLQAKVASDTAKGIVELATSAETVTGTDTGRAVTPAGLTGKIKDEDNMASDSASHLATQQSIKKYVDDNTGCQIKTGTYTGNGSTGQGITGVGFQPKFVRIWTHPASEAACIVVEKLDQSWGDYANFVYTTAITVFDNRINSLDADGFTVDDDGADSHPNKNGQTYDYLALG